MATGLSHLEAKGLSNPMSFGLARSVEVKVMCNLGEACSGGWLLLLRLRPVLKRGQLCVNSQHSQQLRVRDLSGAPTASTTKGNSRLQPVFVHMQSWHQQTHLKSLRGKIYCVILALTLLVPRLSSKMDSLTAYLSSLWAKISSSRYFPSIRF